MKDRTLTVARNWADHGHYGRFLGGQPTPRGSEAAFPMTATVALSFRVFGIGIYQARMVPVLITLASLVLLYELARHFYGRSIGIAAVAVLLCLGGHVEINPLIAGRQLVGEMPALFFLLAGYLCFAFAAKRAWLFVPSAICLWALALFTKVQVKPFLIAALFFPVVLAILQRQFRTAKMFGAGLIGALTCYLFLQYLADQISPSIPVSGLTGTMATVLARHIRLFALSQMLEFGIPTLLGLTWGLWGFLKNRNQLQSHADLVRFSFFVLAGSWFGWYETLSIGWLRYMFPSVFLGSIFVAAMLSDWTNQFSLRWTIERATSGLKTFRFNREKLAALAGVVLVVTSFGQTIKVLYAAHTIYADDSIKDVVRFLNNETPQNALIETYETELFFLLNRRYHYPPDQVHVELLRRTLLSEKVQVDYDPLATNPDYLVVGFQSHWWKFYDPYLKTGDFHLLKMYPKYRIYQRQR